MRVLRPNMRVSQSTSAWLFAPTLASTGPVTAAGWVGGQMCGDPRGQVRDRFGGVWTAVHTAAGPPSGPPSTP